MVSPFDKMVIVSKIHGQAAYMFVNHLDTICDIKACGLFNDWRRHLQNV